MKLLFENWRKYLTEQEVLQGNVMDEIISYLDSTGRTINDVSIEEEIIPASAQDDIEYWLTNKIRHEGDPTDEELIDDVCREGRITTPVIIDIDREYTVEGRHRLFAALKCGLDVPVVAIFDKEEIDDEVVV